MSAAPTATSAPIAVPMPVASPPPAVSPETTERVVAANETKQKEAPARENTDAHPSACNEQPPQDFLIRENYLYDPRADKAENARRSAMQVDSVRYRTERYGYFQGFGSQAMNPHPPSFYVENATFFGKQVRMHKRVIPALKCVEEDIKLSCTESPYTPQALGGIRMRNTYHTGEITNHAYGIAIDIDPERNPCCGCVPPWNKVPLCTKHSKTPYDRMSLPECWVHSFTRYGFYWLGYDKMKDTMHFEFLGDPDKIERTPSSGKEPQATR